MKFSAYISILGISLSTLLFAQPPQGKPPGPWSQGVFVLFDSQPYKDSGSNVDVYPTISYRGEKLQWDGPSLQYNLVKKEKWDFGIHSVVQFAPYEEDDSSILEGMGDRSDTLLAGFDWRYKPTPTWTILASVDAEIFGAYDGLQATFGTNYAIGKPWNRFSGRLGTGLLLQDQNWTQYFVGVPAEKATADRPAHDPSESFHPYLSAQLLVHIYGDWSWFTLLRYEFLDGTWRDSPLIGDDYRLFTFSSIIYSF